MTPKQSRALRLLIEGPAYEDVNNPLASLAQLIEMGLVRESKRYPVPLEGGRVEITRELVLTEAGRVALEPGP